MGYLEIQYLLFTFYVIFLLTLFDFLVWFHSDYRTQFIWFQLFSIAWGLFYHPFMIYFSYVLCILEKILYSVCWMECSINTYFILLLIVILIFLLIFHLCVFQFLRKLLLSVSVNLSISSLILSSFNSFILHLCCLTIQV